MKNKKEIIGKRVMTVQKTGVFFILLITLFCLTSCGSKEAVVLETDELVLETEDPEAEAVTQEGQETVEDDEVSVPKQAIKEQTAEEQAESTRLFVHICGEVVEPGVYELPKKSRIYEAIEAAGGFTDNADESYVNLAMPLEDGMKIRIPAPGEELTGSGDMAGAVSGEVGEAADGLVDINSATGQELCTLPGIGESRAESIIAYREQNGGFSCIEDIMKVDGIKEGMFAKMKDKIIVRGSVRNP